MKHLQEKQTYFLIFRQYANSNPYTLKDNSKCVIAASGHRTKPGKNVYYQRLILEAHPGEQAEKRKGEQAIIPRKQLPPFPTSELPFEDMDELLFGDKWRRETRPDEGG